MISRCHKQQRAIRRFAYIFILLALPVFALLGIATPANAQGVTTGDGAWAWQNPLPQGNDLYGVWETDVNNDWAVGPWGVIVKWNGSVCSVQDSGTERDLGDVWGTDANNSYPLTVGKAGTGSGTAVSTPPGMACDSDCTENYHYGTFVTLTATAGISVSFGGWAGACAGVGQCQVTMDVARQVTATFNITSQPPIETNGQMALATPSNSRPRWR
jgi:hypothetical protein